MFWIDKARTILWEKYNKIEDEKIEEVVSLLKSISSLTIDSQDEK